MVLWDMYIAVFFVLYIGSFILLVNNLQIPLLFSVLLSNKVHIIEKNNFD